MSQALAFLSGQLADAEAQWSLGTFGAIAEFVRDPDEPVAFQHSASSLAAVTERGGIRIEPPADLRLVAFETATRTSWSQRVALCLPAGACGMNGRDVLTEAGSDSEALREQDRAGVLFDLGLGARQADFFVRVAEPDVAWRLRRLAGRSLFDPGNPAMRIILEANPHRVFVSRVGRIEVFQAIPPHDGRSPEGPHTHVLPNLLRHRRTHSATEPIPSGWVPAAHLYPAHPARDALGRDRAFDAVRHAAFQAMLGRFGDAESIVLKQQVAAAVESGADPGSIRIAPQRFARANIRVALRQFEAAGVLSPTLQAWLAAHQPAREVADDPDPHHR